MAIESRFQEYSEGYLAGGNKRKTEEIPLQNIKHTPLALMYGDADRVCPEETMEWIMSTIGERVYGNYEFAGYDHADFSIANDHVYMGELLEALSRLQPAYFTSRAYFEH